MGDLWACFAERKWMLDWWPGTQACTGAVLSGKKMKKATRQQLLASIKSAQVAK
jgi:hypothetical protein